ncbi:MAG: DUF1576 domain-containing protein [Spirochaetota bacterium]|nr:DUF1576 domain-containing protein [Spirochaetota bacterium]
MLLFRMDRQHRILLVLILLIIALLILTGMWIDGPRKVLTGFLDLQLNPARLINDFIEIRGTGAALLNGALVGLIGLILVLINGVSLSGPTYAAIFTMIGFGLFGKTPLNIAPILFGVYLAGRYVRKKFSQYILIALYGTALGPLVSTLAFEIGLPYPACFLLAAAGGIAVGFLLPSIAVAMLHLHQGYNLYNIGLSCGFLGLFAASAIRAGGHTYSAHLHWHSGNPLHLVLLVPVLSLLLIAAGFLEEKGKALRDFINIQKLPGRLPSDFMEMESVGGSLINSGVIGLIGSAYILIIGADFSGPIIGGLFTIIGFAAFGTHLRNSWSVLLGVVTSTLLFGMSPASPGPSLAAIFGTTLGPLAGQFGPIIGFIAGFIHLIMVSFTGPWHGAMNLYNNGFAGGLTATLIVAVIQWYNSTKAEL